MKTAHKNPFPLQPIYKDEQGTIRFRRNAIIQWLYEAKLLDLNLIATMPFPDEDREQLSMLLGYSLGGFSELCYVSDETLKAAELKAKSRQTEDSARLAALRDIVTKAKAGMREGVAELFGIHPDDLEAKE